MQSLSMLNQVVYIVTTGLSRAEDKPEIQNSECNLYPTCLFEVIVYLI
jgi:hypothetical protein